MHIYNVKTLSVSHATVIISVAYDDFTHHFESLTGQFDEARIRSVSTEDIAGEIAKMEGEEGFMIFGKQKHGALFPVCEERKKACRYYIGNPLILSSMNQYDIRAGLSAPLTVLMYEVDKSALAVEFDLPTSIFGSYNVPEITVVGEVLHARLLRLIDKTTKQVKQSRSSKTMH